MRTSDELKWLFVSGCARSGTTALMDVLNQHAEIALMPEMNFPEISKGLILPFLKIKNSQNKLWIGEVNANDRGLSRTSIGSFIHLLPNQKRWDHHDMMRSLFEKTHGKKGLKIIGEKLPFIHQYDLQDFKNFWQGEINIILIVRNPLYVMNSFKKRIILTQKGRDSWRFKTLNDGLNSWIHSWNYFYENSQKKEVTLVKYEDFFSNRNAILKIFDFLNVNNSDTSLFSGDQYGDLSFLSSHEVEVINKVFFPLIEKWHIEGTEHLIDHGPFSQKLISDRLQ